MPLYRTSKKESFLDEVAEFICTNFKDKLDTVKIILPNGYLCTLLQKIIINKLGTSILPSIIPVASISLEGEETFKIPSEQIGKVTALEERMILAKIINSYKKLNYNKARSLGLSSALAKLFFEFEANNVEMQTLKNIPTLDQAEHWHFIYDFLEFAYQNWQQKIIEIKKLTPAQYQKLMFNAELARVKNTDCSLVIAGVIGNNKITHDFIDEISKLPNAHIILPPLPPVDISTLTLKPEDPLYNIGKIVGTLADIPYLDKPRGSILDNLLLGNRHPELGELNRHCEERPARAWQSHEILMATNWRPQDDGEDKPLTLINNIQYLEFEHILQEAEYIAGKCWEQIQENPDAKIAILITNDKVKSYFAAKLNKYGLEYSDLIGENILTLPITTLMLEIAENICKDFVLKDFVSLMTHPLVISKETIQLKRLIAKENRVTVSVMSSRDEVPGIHNLLESWIPGRYAPGMTKGVTSDDAAHAPPPTLSSLLTKIIQISKELCPNLGQGTVAQNIADTLAEIMKIDYQIDDLESLPEILKALLAGGRIFNNNTAKGSNITVCSANDVTLMNYDLLIYTNFADGAYPLPKANNPWLNNQMIEHLGLDSWAARFGNTMYDFYLNLHNKKVLITRSIKNEGAGPSLPSPFLFSLKHILGSHYCEAMQWSWQSNASGGCHVGLQTLRNDGHASNSYSGHFPAQISATDIETLIRAPYNFYAKKILNLKPEQEIEDEPKLSEFGNMFHKIVELYTKNYGNTGAKSLKDYAQELLEKSIFPKHTQKFWQLKIESLEKDFISFDEQRRLAAKKIYSEVRGELELVIADHKVKIVAIADRIELNSQNKALILDYKTGAIPTKKDVLSGLSPQLMIEAIILLEGGFADIGQSVETTSLVYVKINSQEPFISVTEIPITKDDILEHKQGLINLLTHYITTGEYAIEPNLMKYDDYWHLARRG